MAVPAAAAGVGHKGKIQGLVGAALAQLLLHPAATTPPESTNTLGISVAWRAVTGRPGGLAFMSTNILTKIFGSRNDRLLKQYRKVAEGINALEPAYEKLSDDELRGKTQAFKERVANGETLDALLPEAFAVVREGSKRIMKMRHFDVQLIGGMSLHDGKISEMRTGEGKTLTATLAVYLNALTGRGVHVVTVNDYLANRDALWMGRLYNFLGLSVGVNLPQLPREGK